jgi:hypothetical protein
MIFCGKCLVKFEPQYVFFLNVVKKKLKKKLTNFWDIRIYSTLINPSFSFSLITWYWNWIIWLSWLMSGSCVQLPQFGGVCAIMLGTNKFHVVSNHVQVFVSWNNQFFYLLLLELVLNTWIFFKVSFIFFMKKIN